MLPNMKLSALVEKLKNFNSTSCYYYGPGLAGKIKQIYYSFLKINTFIIYEKQLDDEKYDFCSDPKVTIIEPNNSQLKNIRLGKTLPREFFCDVTHNAKRPVIALYDDDIAYIHWVFGGGEYSRFFKLGDRTVEINYVTTLPCFRGRRLSVQMLLYSCGKLKREGVEKCVMATHIYNVAFRKSAAAAGFREVGQIKSLGRINKKIVIL